MSASARARQLAMKVTLAFAAVGTAWILVTDVVLARVADVVFEGWADATKGVLFIAVVSVLLYALIVRTQTRELLLDEEVSRRAAREATLFQASPEAMWLYDPASLQILEVNDTMISVYGRSREELLSMRLTDLSPPADRDRVVRAVSRLGERGDPQVWLHVDPDGSHRWVEITSHALDLEGRPVRLALGRDITDHKRTEEALRASERRLAGVLASMQEMAFSIDLVERRITYLNEVATEVLGRDPDDLLMGLDEFMDLVVPEDRADLRAAFAEVASKGWAEVEIRVSTPGESRVRTLRVRGSAVVSPDGHVDQIDGVAIDLTRRHELEQLVAHQRSFDQLTGLSVRTAFLAAVDSSLASSPASSPPAVVAMFDLDRFADVNESAGHAAGDAILVAVAQRMTSVLEPGMVAARVGGDEFAVFCPAGMASSSDLGPRLRTAVQGPFVAEGYEFFIGMSVGLAEAALGSVAEDLIRDAHLAMSAAKERTSGIELFDPSHRAVALGRVRAQGALRRALSQDRLVAVFQPEIDLSTRRMVAVEALVRWDHPDRGLIPAGEFIAEAERTNLVIDLGDVMLDRSLRQAAEWYDRYGDEAPRVWVNLSRRELDDPAVVDRVTDALETTGAPVHQIGVEVTETAFVAKGGASTRSLGRLADLGLSIALDDFGTGWSSLQSLKAFPLTTVKIDRSFVSNVATDVNDRQIVTAIVGMARGLSLTALAEGVERQDQLDTLLALGCDSAQGFLLGRPARAEEIERLVETGGVPTVLQPRTA